MVFPPTFTYKDSDGVVYSGRDLNGFLPASLQRYEFLGYLRKKETTLSYYRENENKFKKELNKVNLNQYKTLGARIKDGEDLTGDMQVDDPADEVEVIAGTSGLVIATDLVTPIDQPSRPSSRNSKRPAEEEEYESEIESEINFFSKKSRMDLNQKELYKMTKEELKTKMKESYKESLSAISVTDEVIKVLDPLFDMDKTPLDKFKELMQYQGFNPTRILTELYERSRAETTPGLVLSASRNSESMEFGIQNGLSKDLTFLLSLFSHRGANIEKILRSIDQDCARILNGLVRRYNIVYRRPGQQRLQLKTEDITLGRIAAVFPNFICHIVHQTGARSIITDTAVNMPSEIDKSLRPLLLNTALVSLIPSTHVNLQICAMAVYVTTDRVLNKRRDKNYNYDSTMAFYSAISNSELFSENFRHSIMAQFELNDGLFKKWARLCNQILITYNINSQDYIR